MKAVQPYPRFFASLGNIRATANWANGSSLSRFFALRLKIGHPFRPSGSVAGTISPLRFEPRLGLSIASWQFNGLAACGRAWKRRSRPEFDDQFDGHEHIS